ncbi:glutamate ligase domain-containing protein [Paenibacillus thailandensis]|uniref:Glutamate ligase domain-containing protein n=1 Tax=Paenibacillus thailandensis TaxID=393250 RepID=A0ABW5R648_9BACL
MATIPLLVDLAHTLDGLNKLLQAVGGSLEKQIIKVSGCGGDRNRMKRPIMGGYAAEYSDYVVVTSDNPPS